HITSFFLFFFSSRRRHTRFSRDWSSDVCSSDLTRGGRSRDSLPEGGPRQRKVKGVAAQGSGCSDEGRYAGCAQGPRRGALPRHRSEERRVGKECRSRGSS